jgi:glycosyltransferase involved in cell wall biosynthesis
MGLRLSRSTSYVTSYWAAGVSVTNLRVVIDARFDPSVSGGLGTLAMGLAQGFVGLEPEDIDINFLVLAGASDWINSLMGGSVRFTEVSAPGRGAVLRRRLRFGSVRWRNGSFAALPPRDPTLESISADLVHFPFQTGYRTRRPYIYQPHDLQHVHLPEFFSRREIAHREVTYRYLCKNASAIAVGTTWVRDDLLTTYGVAPNRVNVIPLAPVPTGVADTRQVPSVLNSRLPERYVIYPAIAWPHKNHGRLLNAISDLRHRGVDVPLVLTGGGRTAGHFEDMAGSLGIRDLVIDLSYVEPDVLEALIRRATAMVVPTLFEAASFPIWEAFRLETAVACSNVTSLPLQVGDAALLFDPLSVDDMADSIQMVWTKPEVRARIQEKARERVSSFTWRRTAEHFVALYRRVGGASVSPYERGLLEAAPSI